MGRTHVTAYKAMPNAKVTAVCDLNEKQGKNLAEFAGCDWYNDGESMLNTVDIDVVDICLPTFYMSNMSCWLRGIKSTSSVKNLSRCRSNHLTV